MLSKYFALLLRLCVAKLRTKSCSSSRTQMFLFITLLLWPPYQVGHMSFIISMATVSQPDSFAISNPSDLQRASASLCLSASHHRAIRLSQTTSTLLRKAGGGTSFIHFSFILYPFCPGQAFSCLPLASRSDCEAAKPVICQDRAASLTADSDRRTQRASCIIWH